MYEKVFTRRFKKSMKKIRRSGHVDSDYVDAFINDLASGKKLEPKHEDHALAGEYIGFRECHIKPDLLLIYKIEKNILILVLADIGSHAELF